MEHKYTYKFSMKHFSHVDNSQQGQRSSLHHHVQIGSGTYPASSPIGTVESFPCGKAGTQTSI